MYGRLPIFFDPNALEETEERLFPVSKHRSPRVHKKLVKRFGGEFRMSPTIWQTQHGLFVHPALKHQVMEALNV